MDFEDVSPPMVRGETRGIAPGKILLQVSSEQGYTTPPDFALVYLGDDRKALTRFPVVSRTTTVGGSRSSRLLFESVRDGKWHGTIFEISTFRLPAEAVAVALVADGLDPACGQLHVVFEDAMSRPHLFELKLAADTTSALISSVYMHSGGWKLRAAGLVFSSGRSALSTELCLGEKWPENRDTASVSVTPSSPSLSAPRPAPFSPSVKSAPSPVPSDTPPPIDLARLSALERDTAAVSSLLSDIFSEGPPSISPKPALPRKQDIGLDERHAALLSALITGSPMPRSQFEEMSRQKGMMPSGAIETLNDWSFDYVGDVAMFEEGRTLSLNEDIRTGLEHALRRMAG